MRQVISLRPKHLLIKKNYGSRDARKTHEKLTCAEQNENLLHIFWNCVGASKIWAYIILQWTEAEISSAQMVLYKQAAMSQSAPELPPRLREVIKQVFSDNADIAGWTWTRIWWIACSVCVTTQGTSTDQEVAETKQALFRQLRAIAMQEQRRDRDVSNGVYLCLKFERV